MTRVLVAYKQSRYKNLSDSGDDSVDQLIREESLAVQNLLKADSQHSASLKAVMKHLDDIGVNADALHRAEVKDVSGYDLVIAVGGDGTVLDLSHRLHNMPLLGINSDPQHSYGYFCAGNADEFPALLESVLSGESVPTQLMRFYISINGERHGYPILNDVLVCHSNPAAVTSVVMHVGDAEPESQKSSGVWISTPAGSTAAIRSAGGYVMPVDSQDIQYLVREPCLPSRGRYRQLKGIRPADGKFEIISKMTEGKVYLDGPHLSVPFVLGDVFTLDAGAPPLRLHGLRSKIRP